MKVHLEKIPYLIFMFLLFLSMAITYHFFSNKNEVLIVMLIIIFPFSSFITSFIYANKNNNFSYILSILIGSLHLIFCIIIFNFDLLVYALLYIFSSLCGQGSGLTLRSIMNFIKK